MTALPAAAPISGLWRWIPTLYFLQALPNVAVATLSVVMYKNLGMSNADIALYTSWLYLPWVIKPLWSPLVDLLGSKRQWIVVMQLVVGAALAMVALALPAPGFVQLTLAVFWLLAFSSATHDIAADCFYMHALVERQQAAFVGVRSLFFRGGLITGQGALVVLAGEIKDASGSFVLAWQVVFAALTAMFVVLAVYHHGVLPQPSSDRPAPHQRGFHGLAGEFARTFKTFFAKPDLLRILAFLLLYRLAESQLLKLAAPFMLDTRDKGGLGLSTQQVGIATFASPSLASPPPPAPTPCRRWRPACA